MEQGARAIDGHSVCPLELCSGEAYQFDWSHEVVVLNGATVTVKVAHMRLCHSRMIFIRAYPRETQENRLYNRRFAQMCSHYLIEPVACTPASGWEKGRVENQVGLGRERFFTPRLRFKNYDELNAWLLDKCIVYAKAHHHPELNGQAIWEVFEAERPQLISYPGRFDGFHAVPTSVSKTCWCASTITDTRWQRMPSGGRSKFTPMLTAS